LAKTVEIIMDRLDNLDRKTWDNQQVCPVRNANFRKNQNQNQNTGKNGLDQNIRPPFQENYVESSDLDDPKQDTQINLMGLDDQNLVFLSQDEEELHMLQQLQTQSGESFDYKQGYDSAIFEVHKQYNLRSKKNAGPPDQTKKAMENQPKIRNKVPV